MLHRLDFSENRSEAEICRKFIVKTRGLTKAQPNRGLSVPHCSADSEGAPWLNVPLELSEIRKEARFYGVWG